MRNILALGTIILALVGEVSACSESSVNTEFKKQANDNFENYRTVTVIDDITGEELYSISGYLSINVDTAENQLEIIVKDDDLYKYQIVSISKYTTYIVEEK